MNCPKQESLFEFISIPAEMTRMARLRMRLHTGRCRHCQEQMQAIRQTWEGYFTPEPDVTDSLMRVYSRLQNDETLILKGWKLNDIRPVRTLRPQKVVGWVASGGMAAAAALLMVFGLPQFGGDADVPVASMSAANERLPFAQIRVEDKDNNRVQVHYVQPELLQSIEFETTSAR